MRIASIDLGTNTALLLIADVDSSGIITPLIQLQRSPRIGRDVDEKKQIQQPAFERLCDVLLEYSALIKKNDVDKVIACATSAVRDATNRDELISYIQLQTGITIEVISGETEALLTYQGGICGLPLTDNKYLVLDIGGGSTEISFYDSSNEFKKYSLQLGSVRLTERYFKHDPPLVYEIVNGRRFVSNCIDEHTGSFMAGLNELTLVGVAGTVTTLACFEQNLKEFDIQKVSGYPIPFERVQFWKDKLLTLSVEEITNLSNATEGRADILQAGVLILSHFMEHFRFSEVITSERGLRFGMVIRKQVY